MPRLMIARFLLLLAACICAVNVQSQPVRFAAGRELQGKAIYHCYKDRKGFLWFCTDRGITRYNGRDYKTFSLANGLPDNEIFNAYEDNAGRLWLFTYNGSPCYLQQDSVFTQMNSPLLRALPAIPYLNLALDLPDGGLLFGYFMGQYLKIGPRRIHWLRSVPAPDNYPIIAMNSDSGTTIIAYKGISHYRNGRLLDGTRRQIIQAAWQGRFLAIADTAGIHLYSGAVPVSSFGGRALARNNITHLLLDTPAERLFCSTLNGLFVFNLRNGRVQEWLRGKSVTSTATDDAGNYWITTSRDGIYTLSQHADSIRTGLDISGGRITQQASGQIFFQLGDRAWLLPGAAQPSMPAVMALPGRIPQDREILYYDDQFFVHRKDKRAGLTVASGHARLFVPGYWKNVFRLKNDLLVLVSKTDLCLVKRQPGDLSDAVLRFPFTPGYSCAGDGRLYFSSGDRLFVFRPDRPQPEAIPVPPPAVARLHRMQYLDGRLWLFLADGSVLAARQQGNGWHYDFIPSGMHYLTGVELLPGRRLLFGTTSAPLVMDPLSAADIPVLRPVSGPLNGEPAGFFQVHGDSVCFIRNDRLYVFHHSLLGKPRPVPRFWLTGIYVNDRYHPPATGLRVRNSGGCKISLLFEPLYLNAEDAVLEWRMIRNGNTGSWSRQDDKELRTYLDFYGKAVLQARMVTAGGIHSAAITLTIELLPPFYRTQLFYLLLAGAFLLLTVFIIFLITRRQQRHFRQRLRQMLQEHRSVNALLNPHFVFNAINNIQNLVSLGAKHTANDYLATLSHLMRQNMENLEHHLIPLSRELELIDHYIRLQQLRFGNRIRLHVENGTGDLQEIHIPPLTIHTFIENAVVHGYDPALPVLDVHLLLELSADHYLIIRISDNGRGLQQPASVRPADQRTSMGIRIIRQRIERLARFYRHRWHVSVSDREEERGATATIILYAGYRDLVSDLPET